MPLEGIVATGIVAVVFGADSRKAFQHGKSTNFTAAIRISAPTIRRTLLASLVFAATLLAKDQPVNTAVVPVSKLEKA